MNKIVLFFIGDDFYMKSGTFMSPIYEENTYKRWDWGFVEIALKEGKDITIRQATDEEMLWAYKKLSSLK